MTTYKSVYKPDHHRANENGFVAEHIVVAEKKIGRLLYPKEVVHHVDHDKSNNDPDNLMVFASQADHAMFHRGGIAHMSDGVWTCRMLTMKAVCEYCGKMFVFKQNRKIRNSIYCSQECAKKSKTITSDIETIISDIRKANGNFSEVGRKYGVSANAIVHRLKNKGLPYHSKDYNKK